MSCGHTEWTRVSRQDRDCLLVRQSGRLKALVNLLPHPETQTPSLVLTYGPLRQQRGTRKRSLAAACSTVHLDIEPETVASPNPVLLATSFLSPTSATRFPTHDPPRVTPPRRCCSIKSETSISLEPRLALADTHLEILFPYIDVICFPCSSRQCLALLRQQFACRGSTLWTKDRPRLAPKLLVILTSPKVSEEDVWRVFEGSSDSWLLRPSALTVARSHAFGGGGKGGDKDQDTVLKLTRKLLQRTRNRKSELGLLFSARHLMALLDASLQRDQPFPGYVELSRTTRPVAPDLSQHLGNFIALLDQGQKISKFATDAIAASLFLDHYAPGMHGT
ncbi:patatin-like phospholipase [Ilyonectria robusta]